MKMIWKFICIFAFATVAFAQSPSVDAPAPREHRGSYFSVNWGFSYLSSELKSSDFGYRSGFGGKTLDGRYEKQEHYGLNNEQDEFSAWGFPSIDLRFGKSIENFVAVYFSFGGGLFKGEGSRRKQDYSVTRTIVDNVLEKEDKQLVGVMDETFDSYGFYYSMGLGITVYPFKDPTSPLNGIFLGIGGGLDVSMARDDVYAEDYCTVGGIFTRYELGKDWWVSDTWSIGVGVSFSKMVYSFENEGEKTDHHALSLFFRLTRG